METKAMDRPKTNTAETKGKRFFKRMKRDKYLILLSIPGFLCLFVFSYIPLYGIVTAFQDWAPGRGFLFGAEWVGFKWFMQFFSSQFFFRILRNTFLLGLYSMLFTFPIPIVFALMLNEVGGKRAKRFVQSVSYLPHFISTVIVVGIAVSFLGSGGVVYSIVEALTGQKVQLLGNNETFRTIYVVTEVWACFGWDSIIYFAALSGVDVQLYEAATVDGAGRWKKLLHVTIPSLTPVIVIQLILKMGSLLSVGHEKILLLYGPTTYETADVISTYVYRRGVLEQNYSFGSAVGLFNSVVSFSLVWLTNTICKKLNDTSLW